MEVQIILNYANSHILHILNKINIYIKTFSKFILKILNHKYKFTKLCNEFHNETPLIVIESCFLLVLANITHKKYFYFLHDDIENFFCNVKGTNLYINIHVLKSIKSCIFKRGYDRNLQDP